MYHGVDGVGYFAFSTERLKEVASGSAECVMSINGSKVYEMNELLQKEKLGDVHVVGRQLKISKVFGMLDVGVVQIK